MPLSFKGETCTHGPGPERWKVERCSIPRALPGDRVRIRLGEIVPADIKLVEGDFLQVDESSLTGESLPVEKKVIDVAFSGSIVRQGEMTALVFARGMNTYFGRTAKLVESAKTQSHLQKAVVKIGDYHLNNSISPIQERHRISWDIILHPYCRLLYNVRYLVLSSHKDLVHLEDPNLSPFLIVLR